MTALNPSPAAPPSQARSLLAPGEQDLPARGLSSAVVATGISSPGSHGNAPVGSPRQPAHPFSSSQHQPMHNLRGCSSERNKTIPVRVGNDADLRAGRAHLSRKRPVLRFFLPSLVGLWHCHPSVRSPVNLSLFKFGSRNSEHDSKGLADDGNLTAQRIKLTARGRNAKG